MHEEICGELDQFYADVQEGKSPRLMLFMPPRHGKSELVSRRFPAYAFGRNPNLKIISTSYGGDLASLMNRDVQRIIDSPKYRNIFPKTGLFGKNVRAEGSFLRNSEMFEIVDATGSYRSAGVGGAITGMGCNVLLIDDPVKDAEQASSEVYRQKVWEWYTSTAYTRLESGGGVLIILTRWHEDDLAGRLLEKEKDGGDKWKVIKYPALAEKDEEHRKEGEPLHPERFPLEKLEAIKIAVGSQVWASLYQQNPSPLEGGIIKKEWIRYYQKLPDRFEYLAQSWDCTFKDTKGSDYVAGQVWGRSEGKFLMLPYRVYQKMDFGPTLSAIKSCVKDFPSANAILIEDKANGPAVISELQKAVPGVVAIEPYGGKLSRAQSMAPLWESGSVELPDPKVFNGQDGNPDVRGWIEDYIHNICTFPKAAHDDDMDSTSQALNWMRVNSFGLLEVWKAAALAAKKAQEPKTQTEQEVIQEMAKAQLKEAALTTPAAETMQALTGNSLGLLPKKQEAKKLSGCPRCGAVAIARYADFEKCNCGWDSRQPKE